MEIENASPFYVTLQVLLSQLQYFTEVETAVKFKGGFGLEVFVHIILESQN